MPTPNILIITTHDTGRHFGCYGVRTVQTPAIDGLAATGVRFDQMMGTSAICSPSRGSLLTGRYPTGSGLVGLAGGVWNWSLLDPKQHLSHRLREAGYHCAMFGLQHETTDIASLGFHDTRYHDVRRDGQERRATKVAADVADFVAGYDGDAPFYAQVGFFETHTVYDFGGVEPDESLGVFKPPYATAPNQLGFAGRVKKFEEDPAFAREHLAGLQGSVREVDHAVARILDALEAAGLTEDTLVIFTVDHGPELPGAKWTLHEAGVGIGHIMRWPAGGLAGGRVCDRLLNNVDVLPTLYDLTGLPMPTDLQGTSFAADCRGEAGPPTRDCSFSSWVDGMVFGAITTEYTLIRYLFPGADGHVEVPALYDRQMDPSELIDVAAEPAYAAALAEMNGRLDAWLDEMADPSRTQRFAGETPRAVKDAYRHAYELSRGIPHVIEG